MLKHNSRFATQLFVAESSSEPETLHSSRTVGRQCLYLLKQVSLARFTQLPEVGSVVVEGVEKDTDVVKLDVDTVLVDADVLDTVLVDRDRVVDFVVIGVVEVVVKGNVVILVVNVVVGGAVLFSSPKI